MSGLFDGMSLAEYREQERAKAIKKHGERAVLAQDQQKREAMAKAAEGKTPREYAKEKIAKISATMKAMQPGDPTEAAALYKCILDLADVMQFVIDQTDAGADQSAT